jgi:hypothetical protein
MVGALTAASGNRCVSFTSCASTMFPSLLRAGGADSGHRGAAWRQPANYQIFNILRLYAHGSSANPCILVSAR